MNSLTQMKDVPPRKLIIWQVMRYFLSFKYWTFVTCLKALSSVLAIQMKGKDVILKDGISNKFVLRIYE